MKNEFRIIRTTKEGKIYKSSWLDSKEFVLGEILLMVNAIGKENVEIEYR